MELALSANLEFQIVFKRAVSNVITLDDDIRYVGECANLSERFNTGYGKYFSEELLQRRSGNQLPIKQSHLHSGCRRETNNAVVLSNR
jgi:hypothetical protein